MRGRFRFVPRDRWSRRGACGGVAVQQCRDVGQEAGAARPAVPLSPLCCRCQSRCAQVCRLHDGPCLAEAGGVRRGAAGVERGGLGRGRRGSAVGAGGGGGEQEERQRTGGGGRRRRRAEKEKGGGGREQEMGGDRGNRVEGEGVIAKMAWGDFHKNDKILEFLLLRVEINFSLRAYSKNM
ncbi:hypothetical protein PVAP13_9KG033965 [Panicum virgatum]|uniref:Uncharacterized protein n=1 Tax=Panicum virgatum TaxID=38727 RepID=A0A8T0ND78_PANVG|nr:hypothetical protein PVAP13_9KG033965 [Panicum virgatum]